MAFPKRNDHAAGHAEHGAIEGSSPHDSPDTADVLVGDQTNEALTVAATVGVVAIGAALFEVALLPGIAPGVVAMLAPKYVPKIGAASRPMFRSSVRGLYKLGLKSREMVAEANEQMQDIVAEVRAESDVPKPATKSATEVPHV
jgi:hypothetical protein